MKNRYIFDVDGTLTPSRGKIDPEFKEFFLEFMKTHKVWLVTGSDYPKTLEQLGPEICEGVVTCYNCSGNDVFHRGKRVNSKGFEPPKELYDLLNGWLQGSSFPLRMGYHIEKRRGTINFSVIGRPTDPELTVAERNLYIQHDTANRERESIALEINLNFPDVTATVGGETGIDIYRKGGDKSQILEDFGEENEKIYFFGDRMQPSGNDYPLAYANPKGVNIEVKDWRDTWSRLREL